MPSRERRLKAKQKAARDAETLQGLQGGHPSLMFGSVDLSVVSDLAAGLPGYFNCHALKFDEDGEPYLPNGWGKYGGIEHAETAKTTREDLMSRAGSKWGDHRYIEEILEIATAAGYSISRKTLLRYFAQTKKI